MDNIVYENDLVYVSLSDNIGIIYLNNGRENRVSNPEFIEINVLENLITKYQLRALIITGNGKNFSLGADVSKFSAYSQKVDEFKEALNKGKELLSYIENLPILTVALISGACFGAGFEIALSCNFRFANKRALFSFPEVNLGLLPGMGGTVRLPKLVGKTKALEMILTGDIVSAEDALTNKIVNRIVEKGQELEETIGWINQMLNGKTNRQLQRIMRVMAVVDNVEDGVAYHNETDAFTELMMNVNI